ncbi:MAG: Uma2 family endonuclease [Acidobacteria bacterium]|nr:Uma2 family endonuclease [Acidobacteriota bacterium]
MAVPNPQIKFTYVDYLNAPEDKRYELLDGDLVMTPAPGERHQRASMRRLYARHGVLEYWIADTEAGTVTVLLLREGEFEVAGEYGEGETSVSPTLPGFALNVDDLFGDAPGSR